MAAGSGDLANLAGWAAKLAGATCRLAALLHLARHLRNGWARPIAADTFAGAARLADYLVDHAQQADGFEVTRCSVKSCEALLLADCWQIEVHTPHRRRFDWPLYEQVAPAVHC